MPGAMGRGERHQTHPAPGRRHAGRQMEVADEPGLPARKWLRQTLGGGNLLQCSQTYYGRLFASTTPQPNGRRSHIPSPRLRPQTLACAYLASMVSTKQSTIWGDTRDSEM